MPGVPTVAAEARQVEEFSYDDAIVRKFMFASMLWGAFGIAVGLLIALQLANPLFNFENSWSSFGRLRPLHTHLVLIAFAGNAIFCGVYYSIQRLLKARLCSSRLSQVHFWGWQAIAVAGVATLPFGISQGRRYAELEWPIDVGILLIWIVFSSNVFGTIARRRVRYLFISIWFYLAMIVTVPVIHIINNLAVPTSWIRSVTAYSGVQDAIIQSWSAHNLIAFVMLMPFLGLLYFFMPKAAGRPVYSHRLAIFHFWSLMFFSLWAGSHLLHFTVLPDWLSTVGMLACVLLWFPMWGGWINCLLTLRGTWESVASDPVLRFFVAALAFYGFATLEDPVLAIKSVSTLSNYTDWTIAHVHVQALGWVGYVTFGMIYWLLPRLLQTGEPSRILMEVHFWIGLLGILIFIVPTYAAGVTQGLMLRDFDLDGNLKYPSFVESLAQLTPLYYARILGAGLYVLGACLCGVIVLKCWLKRPSRYEEPVIRSAPLEKKSPSLPPSSTPLEKSDAHVIELGYKLEYFFHAAWHKKWEGIPLQLVSILILTVASAALFQVVTASCVGPDAEDVLAADWYSPLEHAGRDIYIGEGCGTCHTQMVRPLLAETQRFGDYSKPSEYAHDVPALWGSRRIGPDLHRIGGHYSHAWLYRHLADPRSHETKSRMPSYRWLLTDKLDFGSISASLATLNSIGIPVDSTTIRDAEQLARAQANRIAGEIAADGEQSGLADCKIVALIAYLQRLGVKPGKKNE